MAVACWGDCKRRASGSGAQRALAVRPVADPETPLLGIFLRSFVDVSDGCLGVRGLD
ncbi:hypothetical protein BN1263320004 [Stenotrophomonas indicatrix]|nr:hypothetical protein BN1263320004 [Stenotrophomonas indicatrix]